MKYYPILLVVFLSNVFMSCQSDKYSFEEDLHLKTSHSTKAIDFFELNNVSDFTISEKIARRYFELHNDITEYTVKPYVKDKDTLMYLFSYDDNWMALSADSRIVPELAGGEGEFPDLDLDVEYVSRLRILIENLSTIRKKADSFSWKEPENVTKWDFFKWQYPKESNPEPVTRAADKKWVIRKFVINSQTTYHSIPRLIATKWGQREPWNAHLPHDRGYSLDDNVNLCATGCVAIALAQMFYFMHYDSRFSKPNILYTNISCSYSIPGATRNIGFVKTNPSSSSVRWDNMKLSKNSLYGNADYVGYLMMEIGNSVGMKYSAAGSGTLFENYRSNLPGSYGISCTESNNYNESIVIRQLQNNLPVMVTAYTSPDSSGHRKGHAWLVDGLQTIRTDYTMMCYCEYTNNYTDADEKYDSFEFAKIRYGFEDEYDIQPYEGVGPTINYRIQMNWGEDGAGDDVWFNPYAPWTYVSNHGDVVFNNEIRLYYDFH